MAIVNEIILIKMQNKKGTIINAIITMNINLLDVLLDDNKPYMDVPKSLFLKQLNLEFNKLKEKGINEFIKVSKGSCAGCFNGCGGFTFLTKNNDFLDLLFIEKDNDIEDLFICSTFNNKEQLEKKNNIYFSFKEDEKVTFNPSPELIIKIQRVERAITEFEKFQNTLTGIEDFVIWLDRTKALINTIGLTEKWNYNTFGFFNSIYVNVKYIDNLIAYHSIATNALETFNNIEKNNETEIINWLIKYEENELFYSFGYTKIENWEQNNLIKFEKLENIIIDATKYRKSIEFSDVLEKTYNEYCIKYKPTNEIYAEYGGLEYKLSDYLSVRNLYPNILSKYNIKQKIKLKNGKI